MKVSITANGVFIDGIKIDRVTRVDVVNLNQQCDANVVLKNGDSGDDVRAMQQLLEANGCKGKMDSKKYGSFGSKTKDAVKLFQKKKKLPQTGECDEATWAKLLGL